MKCRNFRSDITGARFIMLMSLTLGGFLKMTFDLASRVTGESQVKMSFGKVNRRVGRNNFCRVNFLGYGGMTLVTRVVDP